MPFDDRPAGVLQRLLPVLEPGLVLLILACIASALALVPDWA